MPRGSLSIPDLHPTVKPVRAIITTKWGKTGYRPLVIRSIESYYVDTSLDNDADTWTMDIGDPHGEFLEMLSRDNEVRTQIFGVGKEGTDFIMTGMGDEISYDEQGTITLTGRDLSSLAVDSIIPPQQFRHVRAWSIVDRQAKEIGFRQTNLARNPMVKKVQHTDGSESYWEFWYRLYRKELMWLWTEPNGILTANRLNFEQVPSYYFGTPDKKQSAQIRGAYIPVEHAEMRKSTQQRVWEVWIYGQKGDNGFRTIVRDPTISHWIKRPRRVLMDTESHTAAGSRKLGRDEIFEGKVGSLEVKVTIPDPGFMVRQNRVAYLRLPEIGFEGEFYIVGVRAQAGPQGFIQEIRMREKNYALTRRIPKEPKIVTTEPPRRKTVTTELGVGVSELPPNGMPESWGPYFISAALAQHGPWDYNLFLATLLAMADQETGGAFTNIRENGGPGGDHVEWYPWETKISGKRVGPDFVGPPAPGVQVTQGGEILMDSHGRTRADWEQVFANDPGRYVSREYGVGPMQLTSIGVKNTADDDFKPGNRNEFTGGRWHPEFNILAGAKLLRENLRQIVGDSGRDIDIWMGVMAYNRGVQGAKDYFALNNSLSTYAQSVKVKVFNDPGYLGGVKSALQAAREAADAVQDGQSDSPLVQSSNDVTGLPTANDIIAFFSSQSVLSGPAGISVVFRRQAVVYAAMWGYYQAAAIHYVSDNTNPSHLGDRFKDFQPPPNTPQWTDCSGFATWCYKSADAPDPNNSNYTSGYTGTLWSNGTSISIAQLQPGDLVFYGSPMSAGGGAHVAIYVGQGQVVSNGSETGPVLCAVGYRSDIAGFRSYLG